MLVCNNNNNVCMYLAAEGRRACKYTPTALVFLLAVSKRLVKLPAQSRENGSEQLVVGQPIAQARSSSSGVYLHGANMYVGMCV